MPATSACPEPRLYQQLLAGQYPPDEELARLTEHLERCPACAETVTGLRSSDTFAGLVAGADRQPPPPAGSAVERLTERLLQLGPPSTVPGLAPSVAFTALGPYRVVRELGRGGMGVVLLAEDPALHRQVALKVMSPALASSPEARRRFESEARAMAAVTHDHIVPIHHVGEDGAVPYLVMPLLQGESLEARLRREGKLPPAEAARVAREMALGLAAAHAKGLIHRDVKPANVWLEAETGRVKLLDFGLARAAAADAPGQTAAGVVVGTPAYMAPEQADGKPADERTDLFSLGVVLYRMLTGREPFTGPNALAVLRSVATECPPAPHEIDRGVPRRLGLLTQRLLSKEPAGRPELAAVLVELRAVESGAIGLPAARRRGLRRWLVAAGLLAAGGLVMGQLIIEYTDRKGQKQRAHLPDADPGKPPRVIPPPPKGPPRAGEPLSRLASWVSRPELLPTMKDVKGFDLTTAEHRGQVHLADYSPDSKHLAILSDDGIVRIREVATGKLVRVLIVATPRTADTGRSGGGQLLAWSPDGKQIAVAVADVGSALVWDVASGKLLRRLGEPGHDARALAFDSKGKRLAVRTRDGKARIYDLSSGEIEQELLGRPGTTGMQGVRAYIAFAPDGGMLATSASYNNVEVWNLRGGTEKPEVNADGERPLAFSPDGKTLALLAQSGELQITLVNPTTGKMEGTLEQAKCNGYCYGPLRWEKNGKELTCGGVVWDVKARKVVPHRQYLPPDAGKGYTLFGLAPDGKTYACYGPTGLQIRDATTNEVKHTFRAQPTGVVYAHGVRPYDPLSPDGTALAVLSTFPGQICLLDVATGKRLKRIQGGGVYTHWAPDGKSILCGSYPPSGANPSWGLIDLERGTGEAIPGSAAWQPGCSPDGKTWAAGDGSGNVLLIDARTGATRKLVGGHKKPLYSAAWSGDGKRLATSSMDGKEGTLIWDVPARKVTKTLPGVSGVVQWSPDGKYLAGHHIWEAATGKRVGLPAAVDENGPWFRVVGWAPDGRRLLLGTGHMDLFVLDWESPDRRVLSRRSWGGRWHLGLTATADLSRFTWQQPLHVTAVGRVDADQPDSVVLPLKMGRCLAVTANGHYRVSGGAEREGELVYIVRTNRGDEVLTPVEMEKRYGWRNDPGKVRLLAKDAPKAAPRKGAGKGR